MADRIDIEDRERLPTSQRAARPPWGRRILALLVAVAAIGGFATVVVYSYQQGGESVAGKDEAPVITARTGPIKVRPDSPGGMAVPDQDKQVYGQIDSARMPETVERLLPPPEPVLTEPPPEPATAPPPPPAAGSERAPSTGAAPADEPEETAPAPPSELAARPPSPEPAEEAPAPPSPPRAKADTSAAAKAPPPESRSLDASWRIQIAALRSEEAAKTAWGRLTEKNGDLFGKLRHQIVRADVAGKGTFYRLQAGPLADAAEANALCSRVKQRKIGCLVVRP